MKLFSAEIRNSIFSSQDFSAKCDVIQIGNGISNKHIGNLKIKYLIALARNKMSMFDASKNLHSFCNLE